MSSPVRIAIIGGGLGGLTLALSLSKKTTPCQVKIDIYESTASLEAQVGAGIGIWPRPWAAMEALGIDRDLLPYTQGKVTDEPTECFMYRVSDRSDGFDFYNLRTTSGSLLPFHRGQLQSVLLSHLPPSVTVHTLKRLKALRHRTNQTVEMAFEDGTTATADLVIGSDGLQSMTRRHIVSEKLGLGSSPPLHPRPHPADCVWSGTVAYRALIPRQKMIDAGHGSHPNLSRGYQYLGRSGFIIAYPIAGGAFVNFVGFIIRQDLEGKPFDPSVDALSSEHDPQSREEPWLANSSGTGKSGRWVSHVTVDEVKKAFAGWERQVHALVECVESPLRWAIHCAPKMNSYVHRRVAIMGDAAHAMHPHQGSGAGEAIEDAYMLASLISIALSSTGKNSLEKALQVYDAVRVPATQHVARFSRDNGYHFTLRSRVNGRWQDVDTMSRQELTALGEKVKRDWSWAWDRRTYMHEVDDAVAQLRKMI